MPVIDGESYQGSFLLPAVMTGCPGIDVEAIEFLVPHYLEYVGMPAHHQACFVFNDEPARAGSISARVTAYVGHEHVDTLDGEGLDLVTSAPHDTVVDITAYSSYNGTY